MSLLYTLAIQELTQKIEISSNIYEVEKGKLAKMSLLFKNQLLTSKSATRLSFFQPDFPCILRNKNYNKFKTGCRILKTDFKKKSNINTFMCTFFGVEIRNRQRIVQNESFRNRMKQCQQNLSLEKSQFANIKDAKRTKV